MAVTDLLEVRRIAFVSTRIAGTDGVSLEVEKWATILERMGYECFYICGRSDRPPERTYIVEGADFRDPEILAITQAAFGTQYRTRQLSDRIHRVKEVLKERLYAALDKLQPDLLIVQNALTIPLNIPLGIALVEVLVETGLPCIAHHHDFYWERDRFLISAVDDYLRAAFPPPLAEINHVVINTVAGEEFSRRTGLPFRVIPNVMDFANPPRPPDDYARDFREALGLRTEDILILQPTRVVPRKGIEHTLELARRLEDPRVKVVITHGIDDEGDAYYHRICRYAELLGVTVFFASDRVDDRRGTTPEGEKIYTIWDVYPHADLVAYPSTYEGFGNAFLEAVYYRKPIFCNRYTIFRTELEPCGFRVVAMDGFLTDETVAEVRRVLEDAPYREAMVEHNYELGRRAFSYERAEAELRTLIQRPRPWCVR